MESTALYYALSTIAQCAAALAALIGFLGVWRLDRLRDEINRIEPDLRELISRTSRLTPQVQIAGADRPDIRRVPQWELWRAVDNIITDPKDETERQIKPELESQHKRHREIPGEYKRLLLALVIFLIATLVFILAPAIVGLIFVNDLLAWAWTPWLIGAASALLAIAPTCVVLMAARSTRSSVLAVVLALAWASPGIAGPVHCTTDEEKSLDRWQTLCDDGTRAISTYNRTLERWDTTVTPPPGQRCTGQLKPRTWQWEGRCR